MQRLKAVLADIKAALARGGSGLARRESDQQVVRKCQQGKRTATEMRDANAADFARHHEEWHGTPPVPPTPREDPQHAAKARRGRFAGRFLLILKVVFWVVFGPLYFAAIAWLAVVIALAVSLSLSLGTTPMIAGVILKPGLTPQQKEQRLHRYAVGGLIAFGIALGGLFLLRGLAGPLALIGAYLVLPVLSIVDLVLLFMMGVADAYNQLYGWAAPFVHQHRELTAHYDEFEHYEQASQQRLNEATTNALPPSEPGNPVPPVTAPAMPSAPATPALPPPTEHLDATAAPQSAATTPRAPGALTTTVITTALAVGVACALGVPAAKAQATAPLPGSASLITQSSPFSATNAVGSNLADLQWDSTTSLYPSVAETIAPRIVHTFPIWASQVGTRHLRVSTFERDGWLPRAVADITMTPLPPECTATRTEANIFRGMAEALDQQHRDACDRASAGQYGRIQTELATALATASHAAPIVDAKHGRSCTAFLDALAAAARVPAGNLIAIASDTEETCTTSGNPVPNRGEGGLVIIILVPSKTDMGPGVSAAARFNAKKAVIEKIAPWVKAILAPADIESYRLPIPPRPAQSPMKIGFWQ